MKETPDWIGNILGCATEEAAKLGIDTITPDLVFLGMVKDWMNTACELLEANGVDCHYLKEEIERKLDKGKPITGAAINKIAPDQSIVQFFTDAIIQAGKLDDEISPIHFLLALLDDGNNLTTELLLKKYRLSYVKILKLWKSSDQRRDELIKRNDIADDEFDDDVDGDFFNDGIDDDLLPGQGRKKNPARGLRNIEEDVLNELPDLFSQGSGAPSDPGRDAGFTRPAKGKESSATPNLDKYGYDLTKAAAADKLDPVVGREKEIGRLAQILGRRRKNNPILIGDAGVGKSAIAEGLAIRISGKQVPRALLNKRIVTLDIGSLVAGTQYRGQFEERIKQVLSELKRNPDIIVFIDELHTLVGAGGAPGSLDAAGMLKPALARGEIQCIGATTTDEFRKIIEKDKALERRFQKIMVLPTTFDQTLEILKTIKGRYEKHHEVTYSPEAIKACITLSQRYITDRNLPDKAIDVMDEVGSRVHLRFSNYPPKLGRFNAKLEKIRQEKRDAATDGKFDKAASLKSEEDLLVAQRDTETEEWNNRHDSATHPVTEEDVAEVISEMTNILVSKVAASESGKLVNMADNIKKRIIGQDDAVNDVVRAIHRSRAGLKDPNKPIGTFLFLGPTGVGKTQLAKVLAEYLFDTADNLIRIDMSEYMEKIAITRLTGAPPGYVGYDEGGQLSEAVRRKPYSVVLLDEIEKAHPDVFNILLQVLDEGRLTDANGNLIDFRNTVLIMTSNVGSMELKDFGEGLGFATPSQNKALSKNSIMNKALKNKFAPEFLNRLDGIVFFNSLTRDNILKIVDIELSDLEKRVTALGYTLEIPAEVKQFLTDVGYDPRYGARPLKRAIQRYIEDPLSEFVISPSVEGVKSLRIALTEDGKDTLVRASEAALASEAVLENSQPQ